MKLISYISPSFVCGWVPISDPPLVGLATNGDVVLDVPSAFRQGGWAIGLVGAWAGLWQFDLPVELDDDALAHVLLDLAIGVATALTDDIQQLRLLADIRSGGSAQALTDCHIVLSGIVVAAALTDLFDGPFDHRATHRAAIRMRLGSRSSPSGALRRRRSSGTCAA